MKKSESIANIATALCDFQGEITNPKNTQANPFFKSSYSPLSEVINTTRPILAKHGLSVLQSPSGDGEHIIITTLLMHISGEWIEADPLVLKADKITAQGAGSAISYGRRYSLSAILGISSEMEDDGNHASGNNDKPQTNPQPPKLVEPTANLEGFWAEAIKIGFSKAQVLKQVGEINIDKWSQKKLADLYRDLKTKSLIEKVGN